MEKPLVSVVVPVYNREGFIGKCLDSLIAQSWPRWEAIVVDDGSTDNTKDLVYDLCKEDSRIQLFERNIEFPKGAPSCRNIGIKEAKGDFIIFLDSDDFLSQECIKNRIKNFQKFPELDFAVFPGIILDEENELSFPITSFRGENVDLIPFFISLDVPWVIHNVMWKKSSILTGDLNWDTSIMGYQDIDFHLTAILQGFKFKFFDVKEDCYWVRHGSGNLGKLLVTKERFKSHLYLFNKIIHVLGVNKASTYKKELFRFFILKFRLGVKLRLFDDVLKLVKVANKAGVVTRREAFIIKMNVFFRINASTPFGLYVSNYLVNNFIYTKNNYVKKFFLH